jgi:hypothetical protein
LAVCSRRCHGNPTSQLHKYLGALVPTALLLALINLLCRAGASFLYTFAHLIILYVQKIRGALFGFVHNAGFVGAI